MVRWVNESILHGGPIGVFLVPASAPRLTVVYAYQRPVAASRKE